MALEEELDDLREGSFKIRRELDAQLAARSELLAQTSRAEEQAKAAVGRLGLIEKRCDEMALAVQFWLETKPRALNALQKSLAMVRDELNAVRLNVNKLAESTRESEVEGEELKDDYIIKEKRISINKAIDHCLERLSQVKTDLKPPFSPSGIKTVSALEDFFLILDKESPTLLNGLESLSSNRTLEIDPEQMSFSRTMVAVLKKQPSE